MIDWYRSYLSESWLPYLALGLVFTLLYRKLSSVKLRLMTLIFVSIVTLFCITSIEKVLVLIAVIFLCSLLGCAVSSMKQSSRNLPVILIVFTLGFIYYKYALSSIFQVLGVSYLFFKTIDLMLTGPKKITSYSLATAFSYLCFFPTVISGPIMRFRDFQTKFEAQIEKIEFKELRSIAIRFSFGIIKLLFLAKVFYLYSFFTQNYQNTMSPTVGLFLLHSFGTYLYIYFDFSGYCDLVIVVARLLNIKVPENFHFPFKARNIQEFWTRWHITLTDWCRDYIFTPTNYYIRHAFKNKQILLGICISVIVNFIVIGVWHGNTWGWFWFGIMHGVAVCVNLFMKKYSPRWMKKFCHQYFMCSVTWCYMAISLAVAIDLKSVVVFLKGLVS